MSEEAAVTEEAPGARCPVCSGSIEPSDLFCEACGADLSAAGVAARSQAAATVSPGAPPGGKARATVSPGPPRGKARATVSPGGPPAGPARATVSPGDPPAGPARTTLSPGEPATEEPAPTATSTIAPGTAPGGHGDSAPTKPTSPGGPYGRTNPCVQCGAPPSAIDADGYCSNCGRRQPGPREHLEVDLGWAAGVTDRGRIHPRNEDAFHLELSGPPEGRGVVAVVCDGVSTSVRAEDASEVAAQAAATILAAVVAGPGSLTDATIHAADAATKAVAALPWTPTGQLANPACTFVSAACRATEVAVGWVGDSRAYWVDADRGQVRQLTHDDSWAEAQIESGRMTEAEADADPRSHAITRWIGADAPELDARIETVAPTGRGRLLLCSDGLWNYAPTVQAMADLLADQPASASPLQLAQGLTEFACGAGGHDNITVVVIDFPGPAGDAGEKGAP